MNLPELNWHFPQAVEVPTDLAEIVGGHPLVSQALVQRGIAATAAALAFLHADAYEPANPDDLPGLVHACERLWQAVQNKEWIGVWGDFDVDGQTSTALLVGVLQELGANVLYHIPNRDKESHGIKLNYLQVFAGINPPEEIQIAACPSKLKLLLTCDTGITSHDAADWCRENGIDLIITDHHSLPPTLPDAYAVVNPHLLPPDHPLQYLCGVGVSYKVAEKVCALAQKPGLAETFLDLAAIGTIADVAELRADNRWLVQKGLLQMRETRRTAIQSMLKITGTNPDHLNEEHISFLLAPRMNAIGRLGDANDMVGFLLTTDAAEAEITAQRLESLNDQRKFLCSDVLAGCLAKITANPELNDYAALVLDHPEWHPGVVGIVASRLVEMFHKPVLLLTAREGAAGRGSARSIPDVNIIQAISECADLLTGFGGHPMAAGVSLPFENIRVFRRALHHAIRKQVGEALPVPELAIDAQLTLKEINLDLVGQLERLAPFGNGNPALVFVSHNLSLLSSAKIGKNGEHLQLVVEDASGSPLKVLWWNGTDYPLPEGRFDLAYTLRSSNFRGARQVQVEWQAARLREEPAESDGKPALQVFDFRHALNPAAALETIPGTTGKERSIWREGLPFIDMEGCGRSQLHPSPVLVIWTIPPGNQALQTAIKTVQPQKVYLFGSHPGTDDLPSFLKMLAGMASYALNHRQGWVNTEEAAEKSGHSPVTIEKGIAWLVHNGTLRVIARENQQLRLEKGGSPDPRLKQQAEQELKMLLKETAAFRSFYLRVDEKELLKQPETKTK